MNELTYTRCGDYYLSLIHISAVEISYIRPKNQRLIAVSIDGEQASPSLAQAKKLRELDKDGKLNGCLLYTSRCV